VYPVTDAAPAAGRVGRTGVLEVKTVGAGTGGRVATMIRDDPPRCGACQ